MSDETLYAKGKRPHFFDNQEIDALMTALLETMSQAWAVRDHVRSLEKVLVDKGVLDAGEVEALVWPEADQMQAFMDQQAFLKDAFRAVSAKMQTLDEREQDIDTFQNR